jgi:REP element-mobilizing transposase RayT
MSYTSGSHTVFHHRYHIVWITKYRYKVLEGVLQERIRTIIRQVCKELGVQIVSGVLSREHVHMFVEIPPHIAVSNFVRCVKGRSSHRLQMEFPDNARKIDFTGARIRFVPAGRWLHWTTDTQIPVRLRAFRIAEETKNHDLERDLYIEERKAERGVYLHQLRGGLLVHIMWIAVMFFFLMLSNYGRTPGVPFVMWLFLSLIIFPYWHGQILPPPDKAGQLDAANYEQAV